MKIKSLLAAVSMVAMAAGAANALSLSKTSTNFDSPLALELDIAGTPINGVYTGALTLTSGGNFPAGDVLTVTLTIPAGVTFNGALSGTSIATFGPGVHTPANGSVIAGGATTDTVVTYNLGVPTSPQVTTQIQFTIPISVASCANLSAGITVTAFLSGGAAVEGDADGGTRSIFGTNATPDVGCASAFGGTVTSDAVASNTQIALAVGPTNYRLFQEAGAAVAAGVATPLGTVTYLINPSVGVNAAGTSMVAGNIASVTHTAALQTPVGANVLLSANNATVTPATGPSINVSMTGAQATAGSTVSVRSTGMAAIPSQNVTVTSALVTFTPGTPDFITSEPGAVGGLDRLDRQGQARGPYDWNGSSPTGTVSVYRITGLTGPTAYTVTMTNSGANGEFNGIATPDANGEVVLTSLDFGAGVPAYIRGDALFLFETTNTNIDVDRLLARNGVVSAFGDGLADD